MRWVYPMVLGVVGAVAAAVGGASGSGSPRDAIVTALPMGEIVFSRTVDAYHDSPSSVYVMSLDGSHVQLLAKNASTPAVSPNGQQIAFVRDGAIWVMVRDGSAKRQVATPKTGAYDPAWSADGKTIYFTTDVLLSIRSNGTHLRQLTTRKGAGRDVVASQPSPSPDGRIIVYTVSPDGPGPWSEFRAVTPMGLPARLPFRIADTSGWPRNPAWAPNGQRLAYDVQGVFDPKPGADWGIYVSSRGSSPSRRIVRQVMIPSAPAWSSDGARIVFAASSHGDSDDIWLVRPDGTGLRQLTKTSSNERTPVWLPSA
jgi:TolB protein